MKKWYLIQTKSRQEKIAIANLENQAYTVYCPIVKINKKNVVLFPGYLFIHLDKMKEDWSTIRSTKGVLNFVRFGLNYAQVPDNVIDFITKNKIIVKEKIINLNKFEPGDKIQITDGIFKNCTAIFKSFSPNERVILLLKILGQNQTINLKKESLIGI